MDWKSDNPEDHIITVVICTEDNDNGWFVYHHPKNGYDASIDMNAFTNDSKKCDDYIYILIKTFYKKVHPEYENLVSIKCRHNDYKFWYTYWYPKHLISEKFYNNNNEIFFPATDIINHTPSDDSYC